MNIDGSIQLCFLSCMSRKRYYRHMHLILIVSVEIGPSGRRDFKTLIKCSSIILYYLAYCFTWEVTPVTERQTSVGLIKSVILKGSTGLKRGMGMFIIFQEALRG